MTQNPSNLVEYRAMLFTESTEPIEIRRAAVQAIDKHLASRGLSHLIKGQAYTFPPAAAGEAPVKKKYKYKPKPKPISDPGNLKRPSSSAAEGTESGPSKKQKTDAEVPKCVICAGPFHFAKDCPVVKSGPDSIKSAIQRLSTDAQHASTANILQTLLSQYAS
ncbi:hypothetical protein M422DRAFT_276173 [Sphaerobolus stellatus SS14]|uniref:Uncharacterized protein n=1 Tax=Sphaerobolus stellatus (strain SS14) TaxID=990650 RepID=A0A0C9UDR4_SPHS4|nr:hypothetical protein M422DRAFT_276173 [Sphaerobolus stellatus SS14]